MDVDVTALIVALTGILVPITGILAYVFPKLRGLAASVKATDGWVLENQEKLRNTQAVVEKLSPEAKALLVAHGGDIAKATEDINLVKQELTTYYGEIPSSKTKDYTA